MNITVRNTVKNTVRNLVRLGTTASIITDMNGDNPETGEAWTSAEIDTNLIYLATITSQLTGETIFFEESVGRTTDSDDAYDTLVLAGIPVIGGYETGYETEVTSYIERSGTEPTTAYAGYLNTMVAAIKEGLGVTSLLSERCDQMLIFTGETDDSIVLNMAKTDHTATLENNPTTTPYEGLQGDGSTSYVDDNFDARTEGVRYQLNDASYGIFFKSFEHGTNKLNGVYSSAADGGVNNRTLIGTATATSLMIALNGSANTSIADTNTDGVYFLSRSKSTEFDLYIDKVKTTITNASTKIPDQGFVTCGRRTTDGSVGLFNTSEIEGVWKGDALTSDEVTVITNAWNTFKTNIATL